MRLSAALAAMLLVVSGPLTGAMAQDQTAPAATSGTFGLELNTATDVNGGCRLTYVANNNTGVPLVKTSYQVVVFDDKDQVLRFLVLEFGKLPVGKTRVVRFDVAEQGCGNISRLLINDVDECATASEKSDVCLDQLKPTSKASIDFGL